MAQPSFLSYAAALRQEMEKCGAAKTVPKGKLTQVELVGDDTVRRGG